MIRHYKKIRLNKSRVSYFKGGDLRHEINEECVEIAFSMNGNHFNVEAFTYTDLLRLQRVIRRGLKILKK